MRAYLRLILFSALTLYPTAGRAETDRYRPVQRFSFGCHTGQCFDTEDMRVLTPLNPEQTSHLMNQPGDSFFANFRYGARGEFGIARFPADLKVERVILQSVHFKTVPYVHHVQLRFIFKEPIQVYSQTSPNAAPITQFTDLTFSAEALGVQEDQMPGLKPNTHALIGRHTSTEANFRYMSALRRNEVQQYELTLTPEQRNEVFRKTISESQKRGYGKPYGVIRNSCATEALRILDLVTGAPGHLSWLTPFPWFIGRHLRWRKVYPNDPSPNLPNLNEELRHLYSDPSVREELRQQIARLRAVQDGCRLPLSEIAGKRGP